MPERQRRSLPAPLFIVLGAALWGTTGTTQALGPELSTPLTVGAVRNITGTLGLLVWMAAARRLPEVRRVLSAGWPVWVGGAAIAAYQVLFFTGVDRAGVAVGTLVGIGSAPIVTGVLSAFAGQRPSPRWAVGTAVTIVGAAALVLPTGEVAATWVGLLAAVGAGAAYAVYTVVSKRLLEDGHRPVPVMAAELGVGSVALLPLVATGDLGWLVTTSGAAVALWLGLATVTVAYALYATGLRRLDSGPVATLTLTEPLTATLLAILVLHEPFTAWTAAGAVLVIAGLVVVSVRRAAAPAP